MKIVIMNPGDFRVDILDVENNMIKDDDVEMFLRSHGYNDSAPWMAAPTYKVNVGFHEHRMGKDGQEEHAAHEMPFYKAYLGSMLHVMKQMEILELRAAVRMHGEVSEDGTHTVRFCGDTVPMVAGYDPEGEPCDYMITRVSVAKDNRITIYGGAKCESIEEIKIDEDDIFMGFIQNIIDEIM